MVMSVEDDGPAAQAGIGQGDIIVSLGGARVRHIDDLQAALAADVIGTEVVVGIVRGGVLSEIATIVGQR